MSFEPASSGYGIPASPYPGWMLDEEGKAYEQEVAQHFLTAMSSLAATVCVVATTSPSGERAGITATAVCSLSTEPPQLLACINRNSSIARALEATGWFSVNILADHQEALAGTFAGRTGQKGSERFDDTWKQHITGTPLLGGAAAVCVCHVSTLVRQTTHLVVIGRVLDVLLSADEPPAPLMYHTRRFTTVQSALQPAPRAGKGEQ
jgi:flavin reductase (DIM6/NTAB) family NADH-FMN oxidoreductase RutF